MHDLETTVAQLRSEVAAFVEKRQWQTFHSPKNLAMSVAIEAAELMEHFQWIDTDVSRDICKDPKKLQEISHELADVVCYALALANTLKIDLSETVLKKLELNKQKYPADKFLGRFE